MTDLELAKFLGIADMPNWQAGIARLDPAKRAAYEALANKIFEIQLYDQGLGPKPQGVILCHDHKHGRRRKRRT